MRAAEAVREHIINEHGEDVLPGCYTAQCTCEFVSSLLCKMATPLKATAIYTRDDGIVKDPSSWSLLHLGALDWG